MSFIKSRILITGGAGFVGSQIIDQLVKQKKAREIIALDNLIRGRPENLSWSLQNGPVRLIEGDVRDRSLIAKLMQGTDVLFHQAALRITHCAEEPRLAIEVMVDATFELLEEAVNCGVKKVIAASSASVYGLADSFPTNELHHTYNNRTLYGAAKSFNEGLLRSFYEAYGLDYVALRYFNVYGPRMDIHGVYTEVLIRWMDRIAAGHPPLIFGDGNQIMDMVYIEDVARANIMAMDAETTDTVFNVASGTETRLRDLACTLLRVMGSELKPEFGPERKVNPVPRRLADTENARRLLGFGVTIDLEDGLRRLVDWWAKQRAHDRVEAEHDQAS